MSVPPTESKLTFSREEDLEDLFEHAPCGYLSLEPSGRIIRVNATFASWIGHPQGSLVGRRLQDLLNIAGKIYYETHFAPLLRMQGYFNEVALDFITNGGGALPVLVNAVERRDSAGMVRFVRIVVFNATDRRRYEHELLQARRDADTAATELLKLNETLNIRIAAEVAERMRAEEGLRQAQKMEAIGQLTGGVAHDFNNLLTVIIGGIDRIRKHLETLPGDQVTARILRSAEMVSQGADRAAKLTARLLAFSRRQPLDPKPVDAARLITGLSDLLQRTLGETVELETVSGAGLWRTLVDPGELENAVVNLAINARDAMPEGGRLTIETSNASLDHEYVRSITEPVAPGQYVLLAVTDSGEGMDASTMTRVFEPFFTTKGVGKGTGLGLSQVYGFVRQSGGHVRIYSEPGEGTTVKMYLPRSSRTEDDETPTPLHSTRVRGGPETIMVVEDDEQLREFSTSVLRDLGYSVFEARDGEGALTILQRGAHVDLLFTDVVLPHGINGRQVAEAALKQRPTLQVLFTTGYTRNAIVHNGRLDAGVNLITKPFSSEALALKVRQLLNS